jgi:predicted nucleic acid-binding protein
VTQTSSWSAGATLRTSAIFPHLNYPGWSKNTTEPARRWATNIPGQAYAIDHQTAISVVDGGERHTRRMTRFAIDAPTAIRLARESVTVAEAHQLVAPSLLRSEALSILYGQVRAGNLDRKEALETLDRITTMRIRLLGDRVSRATAWKIAEKLDWPGIRDAEYLAVAQLQADAFVTVDNALAGRAKGIVLLAPLESLLR